MARWERGEEEGEGASAEEWERVGCILRLGTFLALTDFSRGCANGSMGQPINDAPHLPRSVISRSNPPSLNGIVTTTRRLHFGWVSYS